MTTSHALVASRWGVPIKSVFGQSYRITTWRSYQIIAGPHRKTNNHLHSHPLLCSLVFGLWEPREIGESPCSHGVNMQMPEIKAPGLEIKHRWLMKKNMANFQTLDKHTLLPLRHCFSLHLFCNLEKWHITFFPFISTTLGIVTFPADFL